MRLPPVIATHTEEVLREILRFTGPADGTLSRYFREHPKLGSRERGVIAEAVYGLLRNKCSVWPMQSAWIRWADYPKKKPRG